jgi:hypothetical protein
LSWILEVRLLSLVGTIECYLPEITWINTWFNLCKLMDVKNQVATDVVFKLFLWKLISSGTFHFSEIKYALLLHYNNYDKLTAKSIFVKMIYDGVLVPFPSVIGPTYSFVAPFLVSVCKCTN